MSEALHRSWHVRWFDASLVALLIAATSVRAAASDGGLTLSLLHGLFLVFAFIALSAVARRLHSVLADGLVGLTALLLIAELAVQQFTGLHVNWFLLSLLLQPDADTQIGFSVIYALVLVVLVVALVAWGSLRTRAWVVRFPPVLLLVLTTSVFVVSQWVYTVAYFDGAARILETRRTLPFFWAPHPYRSNKLLGYVFGPRGENPFAESDDLEKRSQLAQPNAQLPAIDLEEAPNILIVVADSWRSKDLIENPELAPNFLRAGANGHLSLGHYSVSNCTHFSMYSLLTGRLATSFGRQRRVMAPVGLLPALSGLGYDVSTAESVAMDWYNLSDILLPSTADREIANGEDNFETDQQVTQTTLEIIANWRNKTSPQLHLAYYHGTHYPYHESRARPGTTNLARYKQAISTLDDELARLFDALQSLSTDRRTLVMVTSDHGEEFLDEGIVGHASRLTEEQVTVPFLVLGHESPENMPVSHTGVYDFVLSELGLPGAAKQADSPTILANCDYDHPNGFAILNQQGKYEFTYDDGYLVPTRDTELAHGKKAVSMAAKKLLQAIAEDR